MNKNEAIKLLNRTFNAEYKEENFVDFVREVFKKIYINVQDKSQYIAKQYQDFISEMKKIGEYEDKGGKKIEILAVKLKRTSSRDRARVMQRNFVASWLSNGEMDAGLVAFYGDDPEDWRLSFVKVEYILEPDKRGLVRAKKVLSSARRHSFLVGKNEPNHTCAKQFLSVLTKEEPPTIEDIENVFSVENVTREFFENYKELFLKVKENLDRIVENNEAVKVEFENKGISTVDFSKKLLGQIVFLYFIQKKGWLGVERGKEWGTGPKNFMRRLFEGEYKKYDNFFNEVLEPLFYEALSTERTDNYYSMFGCKIPFLNGGLFEPMNDYDWIDVDIPLDNSVFKEIFDTFDTFNFTIKEDEPLEKEVAVDPEMLGKVFENLLEVKDRKSKGAFYTPREIVHYMCQQSLIHYLVSNSGIPKGDIEKFITRSDVILDSLIREKEYNKEGKWEIPQSIRNNFRELDRLLADIKIVDPAVGSGAFPVGMLTEIVKARSILTLFFDEEERKERTTYNLKRETIENSLYGVDIDSSAVDIAKLRFWLSIIVDEEDIRNIKPLPNLDHKIMCGNSLLEEFEGTKLFDERFLQEESVKTPQEMELERINKKIKELEIELASAPFGRVSEETRKKAGKLEELKKKKKKLENKIAAGEKDEAQTTIDEALQHTIKESQKKLRDLKNKQKEFFNENSPNRKKELRREIERLEWELIEATLKEQGNEEAMKRLEKYQKTKSKPFFLWKLHFAEVYQRENPGFDVVIGNPPYIQLQKAYDENMKYADIYKNAGYKTFERTGDIYALFYERGLMELREKGVLTFITSNKWMRAKYGKSLRKFLSEKNPLILIDLGPGVFDRATVDTNILIVENSKPENVKLKAITLQKGQELMNLKKEDFVILSDLGEDRWIILSPIEQIIKEKIEKVGTPLREWDINTYRGVLTGYNEAFIIDGKTKDKLIAKDPKSAEIIKPILRGRDIKRYKAEFADKWLIFIPWHFPLHNDQNITGASKEAEKAFQEQYPALYEHLLQYKDKLSKRNRAETGIRYEWYALQRCAATYYEEFEKEKIVWKRIGSVIRFAYSNKGEFSLDSTVIATGEKMKYLTALLNSKLLIRELIMNSPKTGTGDVIISVQALDPLKVYHPTDEESKPFEELVDRILAKKERGEDTTEEERQIDLMVYKFYGLTYEEVKVVDPEFPLSREEYEGFEPFKNSGSD